MASSDKLPGPVKYPRFDRTATQHTPLLLSDIVILRRVRDGQSIAHVARELDVNLVSVRNRLHYLRERFHVHSTRELAHHPIVSSQLKENE